MSTGLADYTNGIRAPVTLTSEVIAVLSKIRHLHLIVSHATQENMRLIGQLTKLQTLNLSGTKVTDVGRKSLVKILPTLSIF